MVSVAGVAKGFQTAVPGDPLTDPTPLTPLMCEDLFLPDPFRVIPNTHPWLDCLPGQTYSPPLPTVDISALNSGEVGTWYNPATAQWFRDRRPAKVIQLGSAQWSVNSRANPDWWWIDRLNSPYTYVADVPVDHGGPNPQYREHGVGEPSVPYIVPLPNQTPQPSGEPDQFEALVREMEYHILEGGIRRFILHLPAGVAYGERGPTPIPGTTDPNDLQNWVVAPHQQSMNQYRSLPLWKQYYFCGLDVNGNPSTTNVWKNFVSTYCGGSDPSYDPNKPHKVSIEIYLGSELGDGACKLDTGPSVPLEITKEYCVTGVTFNQGLPVKIYTELPHWVEPFHNYAPAITFDPRQQSHMNRFWFEIGPWWAAGARTIWLDAGERNVVGDARMYGTLEVSQNPSFKSIGMRFGGESLPAGPYANDPIDCAIQKMRWLCLDAVAYTYVDPSHPQTSPRTLKSQFHWIRQYSEVHLMTNTRDLSWAEFGEARNKGFVVGLFRCADDHRQCEIMKRWYSMGMIQIADFNGDGQVNNDDTIAFTAAYNFWQTPFPPPSPVVVFASGDINQDGVVNQADVTKFTESYIEYTTSDPTNRPPPAWYGLADDL